MKEILTEWRKFVALNEALMLKPGPNGWDKYCQLVAEAYADAPEYEDTAVDSFRAMIPFVNNMFDKISKRVDVQFVDEHPYETADELRQDVNQNKVLKISTLDSDHMVFDPETNQKFRAVHDYMTHIQRNTNFDGRGEIASYNSHIKTVPPAAYPALFTEVVGQACSFIVNGQFPEQKIAILPGFDYENVGVVEGYDIVDKELVKKGEEPEPEEPEDDLEERCQKGYKTHPTRKTKKMYGKTYRNCVKAEE